MPCVPPHGPHATKSHQGGPGCSCCRSRLPQTQAQGTEIRARPAAAPARTGSAGAEPARERRRGNGGRTAGQTVSGAGSARAAAAAAFLPELVFPGSALLLPRKPRAAGSHGAPLGRRRAHTARSNTPGQERSVTRGPEGTLGAPTKVTPATGDAPSPPRTALPTHQALDPEKPHPPGPGGPTALAADGTQVGSSAHLSTRPTARSGGPSTDSQLCLTQGPPGDPRSAPNPTLSRVAPTTLSPQRVPQRF